MELGAGLGPLEHAIREHFNNENTLHNKLSSCYLIGEQAISLARFSFRLIDTLKIEAETAPQKCKRLIIGKLCQLLREMGCIFNKVEVSQVELGHLKGLGR